MQPIKSLFQEKVQRIQKAILEKPKQERKLSPVQELTNLYYSLRGWDKFSKEFFRQTKDPKYSYPRNMKEAKEVLQFWDLDEAKQELYVLASEARLYDHDWRISTIIKKGLKKL